MLRVGVDDIIYDNYFLVAVRINTKSKLPLDLWDNFEKSGVKKKCGNTYLVAEN